VQTLEESLDGQRRGFVAKMAAERQQYEQQLALLTDELDGVRRWTRIDDLPETLRLTILREFEEQRWVIMLDPPLRITYRSADRSKNQLELNELTTQSQAERTQLQQQLAKLVSDHSTEMSMVCRTGLHRTSILLSPLSVIHHVGVES
jgi:hypothetical protein